MFKTTYLSIAIACCGLAQTKADWYVIPLASSADGTFLEVRLPPSGSVEQIDHDGVYDRRMRALKWGPLSAKVRFVSFVLTGAAPGSALEVLSEPAATAQVASLTVELDADNDGLSEAQEKELGLSDTNPGDALGDIDGDGRSNLTESLAGTDPTDAESQAAVGEVTQSPNKSSLTIGLPDAVNSGNLRLETATNLAAAEWEPSSDWEWGNDGKTLIIPVDPKRSPKRYYRLRWGD